jgi:hypothetical protein
MDATRLLDDVIAAHGGRERWRQVDTIEANLSSGGLAFALHLQPRALLNLKVAVRPHAREVVLGDYVHPGWRGVWTGDEVRILDDQGKTAAQRSQPRMSFSRLDRQVRWDKLDMLYFAGYALWNYLSFPFILEAPGVSLTESKRPQTRGARRIDARFDPGIPTHSTLQSFHLDNKGLLLRHDYTADVIGRWARAANACLASECVDGLRFYTRRRVTPRIGPDKSLPLPTLVWIEIDDIRVRRA